MTFFTTPRDLTAIPVAHPAQFRQKNTAVFLIELNALRVAECIILSPAFLNRGKAARFRKKFCKPAQGLSVTVAMAVRGESLRPLRFSGIFPLNQPGSHFPVRDVFITGLMILILTWPEHD
ncbi:hypothetical protein [Escherichia coli]|uniref:hypothetical protein n=1 Tax=Escherichia coli TaxID=562 RepID=UPI003D80210D